MKRTELNLAERRQIEDLLHRKVNVTEIAPQFTVRSSATFSRTTNYLSWMTITVCCPRQSVSRSHVTGALSSLAGENSRL